MRVAITEVSALEPDGRCQRFLSRSSTAFHGERESDDLAADAPQPSREADLVAAWAGAFGRRPPPAVPDAVLNARFGAQAAPELWLTSTRAVPHFLTDLGFTHRFGSLDAALADVVAASQTR